MNLKLALLLFSSVYLLAVDAQNVYGDCVEVYSDSTTNCNNNCGSCFNPLGRSSTDDFDVVRCPVGDSQGYYCLEEGGSFACMDWTFGSMKMQEQETRFNDRMGYTGSGNEVWFGVGTFGTSDDPMQGLGNCYRMKVIDTNCGNLLGGAPLEREIIAQSINTGHDVANIQFDLQMGNGGTGAFNNCAGQSWSMFPGAFTEDIWGAVYGGCSYRDKQTADAQCTDGNCASCDDLPEYPQDPAKMQAAGDTLRDMCKYSFDKRVRLGPSNPTILDMARVQCPAELIEMTQIQRSDDPDTFEIEELNRPPPYQNGAVVEPCQCSCGGQGCKYCLTRMMDCRKPSAGFIDNLQGGGLTTDGMEVVQPCTNDGYTRIDVKCGCMDCYC